MRNEHVRRLAALESRKPIAPTAGDLAVAAALEGLAESHGHLVDCEFVNALARWNESGEGMDIGARLAVDFVEAVEAIDAEAAAEFYRVVDFYGALEDSTTGPGSPGTHQRRTRGNR